MAPLPANGPYDKDSLSANEAYTDDSFPITELCI